MIGIRAAGLGVLAVAIGAAGIGPGAGAAERELSARMLVVERAASAERELARLERALVPAVDAARRGAARIVGGDEAPAPHLREAAELTRAADPLARSAGAEVDRLGSALRARRPASAAPSPPVARGTLGSIAGQLDATAEVGEDFATMRREAAEVPLRLDAALAALERGEVSEARDEARAARASFAAVEARELALATLPVWAETTDAMIGAVEMLVSAVAAEDPTQAEEAAQAFEAASADAEVADRALRIAVSEGGSAVAATALGRLVDALAAVRQARADVAAILQAARR